MNPEKKNPRGGSRLEQSPRQARESRPATSGSSKVKPPKKKRTRGQKIRRVVFIVLTVIAALIVGLYIAWTLISAPPSMDKLALKPVVTTIIDENGNEIEIEIPGLSVGRKDQFYTFLIVGQDTGGGGNTDTMLLCAYDVPNQELSVMSLPRDTYVSYNGRSVLLNSIYIRGGRGDDGIQALKEAVGDLTGVVPDFYVIIQWDAVGELVDAIGGVYFDVPRNMNYDDPTQDLHIHLNKGYQLLDGEKAMGVVRYRKDNDSRYGYVDGDLGRIKTQQAFLTAVLEKCLQPDVLLPNLMEYISIFQKNVETDLEIPEMAYFGKSAIGGLDMNNVEFVTLPNTSAGDAHLLPLAEEIVEMVNDGFNPYLEDITLRDLDVVTRGSSSGSGSSGSGSSGSSTTTTRPTQSTVESEAPDSSEDPDTSPNGSGEPTDTPSSSEYPSQSSTPSTTSTPVISPVQPPAQSESPVQSTQPTPPPATPVPTPAPVAPTPDSNGVVLPPEAETAA